MRLTKRWPRIMKAEMMNGVMQLVPEYIVLTDRQTRAIRKEISVFNRVCAMQLQGAWQFVSLWEKEIIPV